MPRIARVAVGGGIPLHQQIEWGRVPIFHTDDDYRHFESLALFPNTEALETLRRSVNRGTPFGSTQWVDEMVRMSKLESTVRNPGRPKKG